VTEQERLAAALEYQQAQQPARMNPNLAAQGVRGRENMMPPTSIMDERYPAFKRNQEDAEKLMLGLDIVGSAIPLAGPAMKGAKILGQAAAPQIAQALENYTFKTGMALPMDVWHGSGVRFAPTAKNPLGEFDPTKIGTGEGAQVYGYGHYTAEAKDIGKSYREALAHKGALDLEYETNKRGIPLSRDARIEFMRQAASDVPAQKTVRNLQNANIETRNLDQTKLTELVKDYKESKQGALYKVDLSDEAIPRMLDWDKPLSKDAPQEVKDAFNKIIKTYPNLKEPFCSRSDAALQLQDVPLQLHQP